jgi:hypothetical protein
MAFCLEPMSACVLYASFVAEANTYDSPESGIDKGSIASGIAGSYTSIVDLTMRSAPSRSYQMNRRNEVVSLPSFWSRRGMFA